MPDPLAYELESELAELLGVVASDRRKDGTVARRDDALARAYETTDAYERAELLELAELMSARLELL